MCIHFEVYKSRTMTIQQLRDKIYYLENKEVRTLGDCLLLEQYRKELAKAHPVDERGRR